MSVIEIRDLKKTFKKPVREQGIWGMFKTLFSTKYTTKDAVKGINFKVNEGEIVGYIGANGAGKSTTIKMMCGILTPSSGEVLINGKQPYKAKERKEVLKDVGVVFGQRTQLWWDLPLIESLVILREIYKVSKSDYEERLNFLREVLDLDEFMNQPVRTLSLGQRMRADLAASLIHNPKILFLDEPTIGLDVLVKDKMIKAIRQIHQTYHTTIILTTHNMDDITDLCHRVIILDEGNILYDGPLSTIKKKFGDVRNIYLTYRGNLDIEEIKNKFESIHVEGNDGNLNISFDADKIDINKVLKFIIERADLIDIKIQENSLETIVRSIYENKKY
ncbi:ABC transporter ATP-binding protein [Acholeplasma hippikon]|uniref:ABC transporter ATP-binding protein n=1 Tax=Acholeplasma hippikon TaxID=264636 RepID=A0A449BI26_9MOLU|nr:ATP-binding cassette domain-containing protein [Acholeplasma hippikon]VEU82100.1 ABC transporter ATP-binding protein [Acholeplasma hippikon]